MSYQRTQVKLTAAPRDSLISEVCVSTAVHTEAYGHRARRADPPPQLNFEDQYAFRPTGSTTAAIIAILHMVRSMLSSNEYVYLSLPLIFQRRLTLSSARRLE